MNGPTLEFKPSEGYFRRAIRGAADDSVRLRALGFAAIDELEALRGWVRELGLNPPQWRALPEEAADRQLSS